MKTVNQLKQLIDTLDGQDYGALKALIGRYDFGQFRLVIEQIPKDPYAPPLAGIYRVQVALADTQIDADLITSKIAQIACRDFYARAFFVHSQHIAGKRRGTGNSGVITIDEPGQAVLERSSVVIAESLLEVRCFVGIPASGRKIRAALARRMLAEELPKIVGQSLLRENTDRGRLLSHIQLAQDAESLRAQLPSRGLIAFIADGALLARESGISDRPAQGDDIIAFRSPPGLRQTFDLPHAGRVSGMGIRHGVTLLTGGGFHGKSTLLQAIEMGVYNHISGDGREYCVSLPQAVKVRAYSGRHISKTDISAFIRNLPLAQDTRAFSTENASGSTSQAASIIEAIELGAQVMLMDEDTCATNFMIRDRYMQMLVQKSDEPITSYIDKVRQLYEEKGISTILALGGVGDYFEVADAVIQMVRYQPVDVTALAKSIIQQHPTRRISEDQDYPLQPRSRIPLAESVDPVSEYGKRRLYASELKTLHFGRDKIDLSDLEQCLELSQTRAIAYAMLYARQFMDGKATLLQVIQRVMQALEQDGLDILSERISGYLVQFRPFELAFALNRMRSFQVDQQDSAAE